MWPGIGLRAFQCYYVIHLQHITQCLVQRCSVGVCWTHEWTLEFDSYEYTYFRRWKDWNSGQGKSILSQTATESGKAIIWTKMGLNQNTMFFFLRSALCVFHIALTWWNDWSKGTVTKTSGFPVLKELTADPGNGCWAVKATFLHNWDFCCKTSNIRRNKFIKPQNLTWGHNLQGG